MILRNLSMMTLPCKKITKIDWLIISYHYLGISSFTNSLVVIQETLQLPHICLPARLSRWRFGHSNRDVTRVIHVIDAILLQPFCLLPVLPLRYSFVTVSELRLVSSRLWGFYMYDGVERQTESKSLKKVKIRFSPDIQLINLSDPPLLELFIDL